MFDIYLIIIIVILYIYNPKFLINIFYFIFYNRLTQLFNPFNYYYYCVIDVECVNSVSNRSKDILSFIIKVYRFFLLNNKIFTFHDLFTFTESINSNSHCSTYYNKLLYVCGGEGYCEFLYSPCNFATPCTSIVAMREREASIFKETFEFKS